MKFLIIGDLHGNIPRIYFKKFDALIIPGDFCSDKGIREIYSIRYKEFLKNPYNCRDWWEICGKTKAKKLIKNSINIGRKILEKLNSYNIPVYVVPGNWDWTKGHKEKWKFLNRDFLKEDLLKGLKNIINVDGKIVDIGLYNIIGYGSCNGPELYKYRNYKQILKKKDIEKNKENFNKLIKNYNNLFKRAKKPIIFLSHNVPFNTPLDKITDKKSLRYGYHYGSLIVRKMIEKYQPLICIGGHMHENFGKYVLGRTVCINSGFGSYVNTLIETRNNKIMSIKFHKK